MPSIATKKAVELLGGKVYLSRSRVRIAQIVDNLYMKAIKLFDLASISRIDLWLIKYARIKLFQKLQTLFQMGKKRELLELLDYAEKMIPVLRELANSPDVYVTASGKTLDADVAEKVWHERPIPKKIREFIEQTKYWEEVLRELP